ncbi:MAG: hypothetical protein JRI23_14825 [Deltaproteobacteria bacterium]|jgi:hypothetical protein|nr:hypothetical protein [Deltaproteobacteria bacterium]MBW2533023.1 hypothetical protein [Deltaproteobacteria bacterium]
MRGAAVFALSAIICGGGLSLAGCDDETESTPSGTTSGTTSSGTATGSGSGTGEGGQGTGGTGQGGTTGQGAGGPGGDASQGGQGTGGGCVTCEDVWQTDANPAELCTTDGPPTSLTLFEALKTCACDGTCSQCANSLCVDQPANGSCQGCVASSCSGAVTDCLGL